jgi:hypothetical protein
MKRMHLLFATLTATVLATGCATHCTDCCAGDTAWEVLFDGTAPSGLRGYKQEGFPSAHWVVVDGALKTVPGKAVDLITAKKYRNFELEFEWKVAPGGNSGVMYNVAETAGPTYMTGPEFQVLDDDRHPDGKNPKTTAGALYGLVAPSPAKNLKPVGEWNTAKIVMKDGRGEHWINGAKIVEFTWGSEEVKALIQQSKFRDWPDFMSQTEGHIAFQHHGEEAWYRSIRVREL